MAPVVPVIGAVAGAAASGAGIAGALGLAGLAATAFNAGVGFVVSTAVNQLGSAAFTKQPKAASFTQDAQGRTVMIRSSVETHKLIYGQAKVSGPPVYLNTASTGQGPASPNRDNKMFYIVIPVAGHEIEEFGDIYFNDQLITFLSGTEGYVGSLPYYPTSGPYTGASFVHITKHLGTDDQAADSFFLTDAPNWTDNHRLRGLAYLTIRLEYNADIFPQGIPNISAVVNGKKVYDPRDGGQDPDDPTTWAWSDNSALCVRDYLVNECDIPRARIPDSYVIAAANICDESVTLSTGGSQARYTCNGVIDTGVSRRANLTALLSSMAGEVIRVGSEVRIFAGAYDTPAGTLTDDMLAGEIAVRGRTPRSELVNTVRGTYVDPNKNWQPTDFPPIANSTYVSDDNDQEYTKDLELPFTNHPEAAQRIAKIILEKARQGIVVEAVYDHSVLKYSTWDVVGITQDHLGWSDKKFRIRQMTIDNLPAGTFKLVMQEESSASYDWNAGQATELDTAPDTNLPDPTDVPPPGNPSISESLYATTDGSGVKAKATVSWEASTGAFVREYQVEYKLATASDYSIAGRTLGTTLDVFDISPGEYDFRVKAISNLGVPSDYALNSKEIFGLTSPPADITGLTLNGINNNAHLAWDQATDLDVRIGGSIRVRYSKKTSGATWANSIDIGPALSGTSTTAVFPMLNGTYLVKAVDSIGNESVNAATISSTIADIVKMNSVATATEEPDFSGTLSSMVVYAASDWDTIDGNWDSQVTDWDDLSGTDLLSLDGADLWDSVEDSWDDIEGYFDGSGGGYATEGSYQFADPIDIGKVATCRVTTSLDATVFNALATWDQIDGNWDSVSGTLDTDDVTAIRVRFYIRTTDDDPAGTPTWTDWRRFFVGDYTARGFDFKIVVISGNSAFNINISSLAVTVDMPDVVDQGSVTTSASGLTSVLFARTFVITPKVGILLKNGASGDYVDFQNEDSEGFDIGIKNSAGSYVARQLDWIAKGY